MMTRIPIVFLYLLQLLFPINYLIKFFIIYAALVITERVLPQGKCFAANVLFKSWGIAVAAELVAVQIIFMTEKRLPIEFCDEHFRAIAAAALVVSQILSFALHFSLAFGRTETSRKQKAVLAAVLVALTAPYLLLMSTWVHV